MKKALVVGIDRYDDLAYPLQGCANDANAVAAALEKNGDGSPNFSVLRLTSDNGQQVTASLLLESVSKLLSGDAETAVFYFAGHGILNEETNAGYLVSQDGRKPNWGLSLSELLNLANDAHPSVRSVVIILDACQSGFAGETTGLGSQQSVSALGNGVTILTACDRAEAAAEFGKHGVFTSILLDALSGAASDVLGRVTPASLYAHVDQTLGAWEQRPIYKANVKSFITLRQVPPKVPLEVLRRLPEYFPQPGSVFKLDPSYEPDRGEQAECLKDLPVDEDNVRKYRELQQCNRHGLVVPVDQPHMWHAAINATGCKLTATGAHYRCLAERDRI